MISYTIRLYSLFVKAWLQYPLYGWCNDIFINVVSYSQSSIWLDAIKGDIQSMKHHSVWKLTCLKITSSLVANWHSKLKEFQRKIVEFKAKLVTKVFTLKEGWIVYSE